METYNINRLMRQFSYFLMLYIAIVILSWPVVLSLNLWLLKDRGNLLNVDYLLDEHLRLGADVFYTYGLLPILLQRWVFALFGRGAWPMLGLTFLYLIGMAVFCALLRRHLPPHRVWLLMLLALAPIMLWVNPNFPCCLVQLSILFALLLVLEDRLDLALAVAAVGCVSVPSIPLVLAVLLVALILLKWRLDDHRSIKALAAALAPGAATYLALTLVLRLEFDWDSILLQALPIRGAQFYQAERFSFLKDGIAFLSPPGATLEHYFMNRPAWWVVGTILLFGLGAWSAVEMIRRRRLSPAGCVVFLCAALQAAFILFAYGVPDQHIIYDPLIVVGDLIGLSRLTRPALQRALIALFVALGVISHGSQIHQTWLAWRTTRPSPVTLGFYVEPDWTAEWSRILETSSTHKTFLLSYATGVHHYFPTIGSPDLWCVNFGQVSPEDAARLLAQLDDASVIVEDLMGPTRYIDNTPDIQRRLDSMCLTDITPNFQIWWRDPPSGAKCQMNPRRFHGV